MNVRFVDDGQHGRGGEATGTGFVCKCDIENLVGYFGWGVREDLALN